MKTTDTKGFIVISNYIKHKPFFVEYDEIDSNTIQLDIIGEGVLNYEENYCEDLDVAIHTNINNKLIEYSKMTNHNSSEIGYSLNIFPTKRIDRKSNLQVVDFTLSIVFQKPFIGKSTYELNPTITLISYNILESFFVNIKYKNYFIIYLL